ncbi:MAG: glycosyltransferase family 9 protein, partial [Chitinivibrionales bacterium]
HISISQNTPVVSLFGPTSLKSRVPSNLTCFSIQSEAECSPCYVHGRLPLCQHRYVCMERITPEDVAENIQKVLKG